MGKRRRGSALLELVVAGGLTAVIISGVVGLLSLAGRQDLQVNLTADANQDATVAMRHIQADIREATSVSIVRPNQVRFYYPVRTADGLYDRTRPNEDWYLEYVRSDADGKPSNNGNYLTRRTSTDGKGKQLTANVSQFSAEFFPPNADNSVRFTLRVRKSQSGRTGETQLDQRVLYMRNYYGLN